MTSPLTYQDAEGNTIVFTQCHTKYYNADPAAVTGLHTEAIESVTRDICDGYKRGVYQIRNEWMVDHSARVIAVWNGAPSGTKNTVDYANRKNVPVVNVYRQ